MGVYRLTLNLSVPVWDKWKLEMQDANGSSYRTVTLIRFKFFPLDVSVLALCVQFWCQECKIIVYKTVQSLSPHLEKSFGGHPWKRLCFRLASIPDWDGNIQCWPMLNRRIKFHQAINIVTDISARSLHFLDYLK